MMSQSEKVWQEIGKWRSSSELFSLCENIKVVNLVKTAKKSYAEVAKILCKNEFYIGFVMLGIILRTFLITKLHPQPQNVLSLCEIIKKDKEIHDSFATAYQTAKVNAIVW